jgi:acetyl esterase/lipase
MAPFLLCVLLLACSGLNHTICWLSYILNRRPPEHPCPVAIDDAVRAYRWMLSLGIDPSDIYLAGDSAGGALAVSCILALAHLGDPLPAGSVLMSPWVDVSDGRDIDTWPVIDLSSTSAPEQQPSAEGGDGGVSRRVPNPQRPSFRDNAATDYITAPLAQLLADAWASGLDLQDARVSPLFSDQLAVLPPMLVQVRLYTVGSVAAFLCLGSPVT